MREIWDELMGVLLHDPENERVLLFILILGIIVVIRLNSRGGHADGGGDGGDGDGC